MTHMECTSIYDNENKYMKISFIFIVSKIKKKKEEKSNVIKEIMN